MAHHRVTFLSLSLGTFLILTTNIGAQAQKKAVWQLTPEERAAGRQAEIARQRGTTRSQGSDMTRTRISGAATPELFLPIELFRHLVLIAFDPNPAGQDHVRRGLLDRATTAGITLPSDFWPRLESTVAEYLASNQRAQQIAERIASSTPSDRAALRSQLRALKVAQCRLREAALDQARAEFGNAWFDRFLYTAVAPITTIFITGHEPADPAELLRDVQGGCQ